MAANPADLLTAALMYAEGGWYVFPVIPDGKRPAVPSGFHAATLDATQIRRWWAQWPTANIGIATDPSGLTVYDVDVAGDKPGLASHDEIAHLLPATLAATTRSGGKHLYYAAPQGPPLRRIGIKPDGVSRPRGKTGLDLIAKGYVLAPPSVVDGKSYTWDNLDTADVVPLPDLLARAASEADPRAPITETDTIGEGERNNTLFRIACRMRGAGLTVDEVFDGLKIINANRVRPPLPEHELLTIAQSAGQRAETDTDRTDELLLATIRKATGPKHEDVVAQPDDAPDDASQFDTALDKMLLGTAAAEPTPAVVVYPSGFSRLDELLGGGFATRQACIVLGGPGAGKSAFGVSLARSLTTPREGYEVPPVLLVSTELEFPEVAARFASPLLGTPWRDIVRSTELYQQVAPVVQGYPVYVLDTSGLELQFEAGLTQIYALAKRIEARHGKPPVVIVDYLQELAANVNAEHTRQKTSEVATALRIISQKVPCAVIALASVSRAGYGNSLGALRENNEPEGYVALAKESGHIEYAAATVLFIDIEHDETHPHRRSGRFVVAKARHGHKGFCGMTFDPAFGVFAHDPTVGATMSNRKSRDQDIARVQVLQFIASHPGKYTQSEVAKMVGGAQTTAAIAGLLAEGKILRDGKVLVLNLSSDNPLI